MRYSKRSLITFSGLTIPITMAELPFLLFLPAFYTQEIGLGVGLVGAIFLAVKLWDGISDPVIGWLSDRSKSRYGRRKPMVIMGAPLLMISLWNLCNPGDDATLTYLTIWAILFYTAHTLVKIPYFAWAAELSTDYKERNRVTAFRDGALMVGNLLAVAAPLFFLAKDTMIRDILFLLSSIIVVLIPLMVLPLSVYIPDPKNTTPPKLGPVKGILLLSKNRPLIGFIATCFLVCTALGAVTSVFIFFVNVRLNLPGAATFFIFVQYIVSISMIPIVVKLANRFEKHRVLAGGMVVYCLSLVVLAVVPGGNYYLTAIGAALLGVGFTSVLILPYSITADIVDYDTAKHGEQRAGVYVAAVNFFIKVGYAAGLGIAYGFLHITGYDPSSAQQNLHASAILNITFCLIPVALTIPAIVLVWNFPINKARQQQLRQEIEHNNRAKGSTKNYDINHYPLGKEGSHA